MKSGPRYFVISSVFTFTPSFCLGHAGQRGFVMLLPTDLFILGGGIVVALTFLFVVLMAKSPAKLNAHVAIQTSPSSANQLTIWSRLTLILLIFFIFCGFFGSRDPLENPLPLILWMGWWVGWTFVTVLFGDFWNLIHPWHALDEVLRKLPGLRHSENSAGYLYPPWLGYWPSVFLFYIFAWIELIHPSPMDPEFLATGIIIYMMLVSTGMILFGKEAWLSKAEPFCVFFRMVGWLSPVKWQKENQRNSVMIFLPKIQWPCMQLLELPTIPKSGTAFILLVLSTVSFDGLSKTFWWMALIGENPLEYPGRTVLMLTNTAGMLSTFLIFLLFYALTQIRISESTEDDLMDTGFVFSIIPIAFGYHFAHYLPNFLVDIQYAFISLSDPLDLGWNLLGIKDWQVRSSFLTHHESVVIIWYLQITGIVLAHIAAVIIAHLKTLKNDAGQRTIILSQIPSTLLMIAYTFLGLWLLSTPIAA